MIEFATEAINMSLFPAYSDNLSENVENTLNKPAESNENVECSAKGEWLENSSFVLPPAAHRVLIDQNITAINDENVDISLSEIKTKKHKERKKKKKKHSKSEPPQVEIEFTGNEEYYVDKIPAVQYNTIRTLHKPACPRYRSKYNNVIGRAYTNLKSKKMKRYYKSHFPKDNLKTFTILHESEYINETSNLNRSILQNSGEVGNWVKMVELQDRNPYKWSKLYLAEKKLEILQRALQQHPSNEIIYRIYIEIIYSTYPSFEVSKIIDKLLQKDPYNCTLWEAQIQTTQCSMARCIAPDVLKIYEKCMQKMHRKAHGDDTVMLKLFNNCAQFLRQSGSNEQFFALIKLALELNVSPDKFNQIQAHESDQQTLIEYEELILQSGLPMNEIWLRIEKLRQGFNFLPYPINSKCSDPQRIVFNEDICHYIYPLASRDNSFFLILLILRLLKVPFIDTDCLARKFCAQTENICGDSDAIEDAFAILLHHENNKFETEFRECLYEIAKDICVSPTFLNSVIAHEIYINTLKELLLILADCYAGIDERKRIVFIVIWLRFLRLLTILQKSAKKLTPEYIKDIRGKIKNVLKKDVNRNILNFYTELALLENEITEEPESKVSHTIAIFKNVLTASNGQENLNADVSYAHIVCGEILMKENQPEKALNVFVCYALHEIITDAVQHSPGKTLAALKKLTERLDNLIAIEKNVVIMELDQYFLPDFLVNLFKIKAYMQNLLGQKLEALAYLEKIQEYFVEKCDRHIFLREKIFELQVCLMQCTTKFCNVSNLLLFNKINMALKEFPQNLFLLKSCSMLLTQPWYKVRSVLLHSNSSILSLVFVVGAAKLRYGQQLYIGNTNNLPCDNEHIELTCRNRILNVLKSLMREKNLQRNALYWRFYLRCLSDQRTAFETTKKCLLTALDECPWNKSLYLDGATFVPQELSHLQDLIIEKQLRIYALPEELEILRTHDVAFTE